MIGMIKVIGAIFLGLLGLGALARRWVRALKERRRDPAAALLLWVLAGLALCLLIPVNANRMNFLLLPLVLCAAFGAETLLVLLGRYARAGAAVLPRPELLLPHHPRTAAPASHPRVSFPSLSLLFLFCFS